MPRTKPISFDSLDRDELLVLAKRHCCCTQRDLVAARYEVASRRYFSARDESHAAWDRWICTSKSYLTTFEASDNRARLKSLQAELTANDALQRVEAKVRRLKARRERLWKLYEELQDDSY